MALYTKAGDEGFTYLPAPGGKPIRLRKDDPRMAALGGLDELNACLGFVLAEAARINHMFVSQTLGPVQEELLRFGAILAAQITGATSRVCLGPESVKRMERDIDAVSADLPELKHFILPKGSELAARLHLARAVCRRGERAVVSILNPPGEEDAETRGRGEAEKKRLGDGGTGGLGEMQNATEASSGHGGSVTQPQVLLKYLNRLSDLLFALSRLANRDSNESEVPWTP